MSENEFGYNEEFRAFASDYYDVDEAIKWLRRPVPDGYRRWRCLGCGYAMDVKTPEGDDIAPATCCGACGYCLNRPIEEFNG